MSHAGVQIGQVRDPIPATPDPALERLPAQIKAGECILFLGAGVHAPPEPPSSAEGTSAGTVSQSDIDPSGVVSHELAQSQPIRPKYSYPPEFRPLLGRQLTEKLATECTIPLPHDSVHDLQRVALCFEKSRGLSRATLVARLNDYLMANKRPSPVLEMLAAMPFRIIVTTNYDRLMETALRAEGKDPNIVIYDPSPDKPTPDDGEDPSEKAPLLFKMHGDLNQRESIVITDEDYITFVQRMSDKEVVHPVPMTIRYRMKKWSTLFVGYSLRDYNLRLLFRTLRWRVDPANFPPSFSIDRDPDPLILQVWQNERQFITFVAQDMWSSIPYLYREVTGKEFGK